MLEVTDNSTINSEPLPHKFRTTLTLLTNSCIFVFLEYGDFEGLNTYALRRVVVHEHGGPLVCEC